MSESTAPKREDHSPTQQFKRSERLRSLTGIRIVGIGTHVPERVVTNEELERAYGFEPGWVERRTGILTRRYAARGEGTSKLCIPAARRAMEAAGVEPKDIDLLVVGTFTPDYTCPSTACLVQSELGLDAPAFDVSAACSGFMYALVTGAQFVATGNSKLALVIGADVNTTITDPQDQGTAPLFGDGAGAILLTKGESDQGLVSYQLGADGSGGNLLMRNFGGSTNPTTPESLALGKHHLKMEGRTVFKWAVQVVTETIMQVLDNAGVKPGDVNVYLLHQANIRIINHAMDQLQIPRDRVINNLDRHGNTSAASIPLVMEEAYKQGKIRRGDLILMCGFGAGLTWGTGLYRW